ncbi:MAG TPA: CPBP family intramembrane glutamic endopeptidase [Candidatus Sulfopaludibacter sp.]|jgi:hypothetical protein|nr:CPBP family intramembrane glutamic endopeptidase [Candidatus Sulfopaludibacter sp.]
MSDEAPQDLTPEPVPSPAPSPAPIETVPVEAAPPPEPERYPFWTYTDLLLVAGMTLPCMAFGILLVKGVLLGLRLHPKLMVVELLPAQLLGYIFIVVTMTVMFRIQYDHGFWQSLAWRPSRVPVFWIVISGIATAVGVAMAASLLKTPQTSNPMTDMMQDRTSLILLAIFGIGIAPVAEELAFRGFLQPLLVRSFGTVVGILGAAIPFGILHFHEYGDSWRHAVVISLAGAGFGAMRQATGSTRAAAAMHASYNGFLFLALFISRKDLPHLW